MEINMKNTEKNKKKPSIKTRVLAGVLAALMLARVVFGLISFLGWWRSKDNWKKELRFRTLAIRSSFLPKNILFRCGFLKVWKRCKTFLKKWIRWINFETSNFSVRNSPYKNYTKPLFELNCPEKCKISRKFYISELCSLGFWCVKLGNGKMYFLYL